MIKCFRCGFCENESEVQEHHIIPKCCGGTDKEGRIHLCKKCHDIIHKMLLKVLWDCLSEEEKEIAKKRIEIFTNLFIENGESRNIQ